VTHRIKHTQHINALTFAECRILFIIMLNVILLSVVMLSVVMLSVLAQLSVALFVHLLGLF
jgi:hypothetical protein